MGEPIVLVVDEERNTVELLKQQLGREGYQVETGYDGRTALEKASSLGPVLIMLGLTLPDVDGLTVCGQIRQVSPAPIIVLTPPGRDRERVIALELGADDCLVKPFNPHEMMARVRAVLRRYAASGLPPDIIILGDLTIDANGREVTVAGRKLGLRKKEFDLLVTLARQPGVTFSRDKLLSLIWGSEYDGDTRTIDVHVAWLRDKLVGSAVELQTVWGVGYRLVVP